MKSLISTILILLLFGCNSNKEKQSESSNEISKDTIVSKVEEIKKDTIEINYQIAIDFLNSYIERDYGTNGFIEDSPLVTETFKKKLDSILKKAWEDFPELGLEFDPIFDGQDYPTDGFELLDIDKKAGYAIVKGIKWESFEVTLNL